MAEIKDGILGGVHGTVGTVVGIMWRGRYFLRAKPSKSNKPASDKQILQRGKMKLVSPFTSKIRFFVNAHYPPLTTNKKVYNGQEQLNSQLLKEGIEIIEGEPCLAIEKVILSLGVLPSIAIKKISFLKEYRVKVLWDDSLVNILTQPKDKLSIITYNDYYNEFHLLEKIAERQDKYTNFELPTHWEKGNIHLWSIWTSIDKPLHSTSIYHSPLVLNKE